MDSEYDMCHKCKKLRCKLCSELLDTETEICSKCTYTCDYPGCGTKFFKGEDGTFGLMHIRCFPCHEKDPECKEQHERCNLDVAKCCLCQDKRHPEESGRYFGYEDNYGMILKDARYTYYCPSCKDYYSQKYGLCYICFIGAADYPIHKDSKHAHSVCRSCYSKLEPEEGTTLKCPICREPEPYKLL